MPPRQPFSSPANLDCEPVTLRELERLLELFLTACLEDKSGETVGTYRRSLHAFQQWSALEGGSCRFTSGDIGRYKKYLVDDRGLSEVSVSTYLTALRSFCRYLVSVSLLTHNPAKSVKGNKRPTSHSRQVLTEVEVAALIGAVDDSDQIGKRDLAMVHFMLYVGLSEIEIVRADIRDLEQTLYGPMLRVQGKGRVAKDQRVPLAGGVEQRVESYLSTRTNPHGADPLFVSHGRRSMGSRLSTRAIRSRVTVHLAAAGITRPGITPHSLTHTAPVIWLDGGMDISEVRQRMRHGSQDTTMIYVRKREALRLPSEGVPVPEVS